MKRLGCVSMFIVKSGITALMAYAAFVSPVFSGTETATWPLALLVTVLAWKFIPRCLCLPEKYRDEEKPQEPIPAARLVRGKEGRDVR